MPEDEGGGLGGYIPPGRLDRRDRGREDEREPGAGPRLNRRDRGYRDRHDGSLFPPEDTLPTSGLIPDLIDDLGDVEDELEELKAAVYCGFDKVAAGTIINPQSVYTSRPQIPLLRAEGDMIITRIHIVCSSSAPTTELAGDLKYADDMNTGSFANATVIDVCDTTGGVFTAISGFDDDSVPKGKYIYFEMDASPHADITDFYIEVYYT